MLFPTLRIIGTPLATLKALSFRGLERIERSFAANAAQSLAVRLPNVEIKRV